MADFNKSEKQKKQADGLQAQQLTKSIINDYILELLNTQKPKSSANFIHSKILDQNLDGNVN